MTVATETGSSKSSFLRVDYLVYLFIFFEACLYWAFSAHYEDIAPDSSTYQGLARSLRDFGSYQFNFAPHVQYPPGLPLLLAVVGDVFGDNHIIYLRTMAVTGMLSLWACYEFLKQEQNREVAAVATLLLGVSGYFFTFSAIVLNSDVPYLCASIASLFVGKQLEKPKPPLLRWMLSIALCFLLVYCVILRTAGITLVGGFFLWFALSLVKNRSIRTIRLATYGLPLALALATQAAWTLYGRQLKSQTVSAWGGSYADVFFLLDPHRPELGPAAFVDILLRIPTNLVQHSAHLFELTSGLEWVMQTWLSPFVLLPMGLVAWGFLESAYRHQGAVEFYFMFYAILYSLWPYDVGARFVLPIFPIAFLYAWRAIGLLLNLVSKHPAGVVICGFVFSLILAASSLFANLDGTIQPSQQVRFSTLFWAASSVAFGTMWFAQTHGSLIGSHAIRFFDRPMLSPRRLPSFAQSIGVILLAMLVVKGIINEGIVGKSNLAHSPSDIPHSPSVEAARWIKANAQESDIVMAQQLQVVHYVSGRRVVGFPATSNPQQVMQIIRSSGVRFLIVITDPKATNTYPSEADRLLALKSAYGGILQLAHEASGFQLFKIAD